MSALSAITTGTCIALSCYMFSSNSSISEILVKHGTSLGLAMSSAIWTNYWINCSNEARVDVHDLRHQLRTYEKYYHAGILTTLGALKSRVNQK